MGLFSRGLFWVCAGIYLAYVTLHMLIFSRGYIMNHLLFIKNSVRQKDAISGVVTGLGVLAVETAYLVFAIILGINLFKRGTFYQILKRAGEGDKTSNQSANVLGTLIYTVLVLILLPVVKAVSTKIFGS